MCNKLLQNLFCLSLVLIAITILQSCKNNEQKCYDNWKENGVAGMIELEYPQNGTLFPPEFQCPTFLWEDSTMRVNQWMVNVETKSAGCLLSEYCKVSEWKPDRTSWEKIKAACKDQDAYVTIIGVSQNDPTIALSGVQVNIRTSTDSVAAPIMYRDVILPVRVARENLDSIKWRLCNVGSDEMSHVALKELPVCGNCHSFSLDGSTFGMDVDASLDKGAYTITDLAENMEITNQKIITWTSLSRDPCLGLLSKVSPNGRYVATTIDDNSVLVNREDPMYSQFFFPIRGELAIYDRKLDTMYRLPGACDPEFCQSNPNWSPDGNYIVFTRAPAITAEESGITNGFDRDVSINKPFVDKFVNGEREYKYNLYRIPFNEGKGGVAEPLTGGSHNKKSNYFARYSPDGKWIVFCQAENFMLLMGDSRLYIMPAEGGEPRLLNCNMKEMNSYHSWSPNSHWIVVATKERGPYTQMYLTHIDENGMDSPPVFIETATPPGRAVNIPEFVNIPAGKVFNIIDKFTETGDYLTISEAKYRASIGEYQKALKAVNKAIKLEPKNLEYYDIRAYVKGVKGDWTGAVEDYSFIIKENGGDNENYHNRGIARKNLGDYNGAIEDFTKCISMQKNDTVEYYNRALVYVELKNYKMALDDFNKVLELDPADTNTYFNRGLAELYLNNYQEAITDLEKACKLNSKEPRFHYYAGIACLQLKQYPKSEDHFSKAITINEKYAEAWLGRGRARKILNKRKDALKDYSKAIELNPQYPDAYQGRGELFMFEKDFQAAIKDYNIAINLSPSYMNYAKRGDAYMEVKDYLQAIIDYDKAIELNPKLASAWFMRGKAKINAGHKDDGCKDLNEAFSLGYLQAAGLIQQNCVKK